MKKPVADKTPPANPMLVVAIWGLVVFVGFVAILVASAQSIGFVYRGV